MSLQPDADLCYEALMAHDRRFDGVFFTAVKSTGIYCRPVCTARVPLRKNCRFFFHAAQAEAEGFRPCLRCRPELAPGQAHATVDAMEELAAAAWSAIEAGELEEDEGLEGLALELGVSSRHLRRAVKQQFGISPVKLLQTHRLLLAKRLLTETSLPVSEVALSSGFNSLRRFNALYRQQYGMNPTGFRKLEQRKDKESVGNGETVSLFLSYRPPYAWKALMAYLQQRCIPGVEWVTEEAYARTVRLAECKGWLRVTHEAERHGLRVQVSHSLLPGLNRVLAKLRALFDLDAHPQLIAEHLGKDASLAKSISEEPGLRVAGAFDGFEAALRTVLGQQITIKAATTLMARVYEAFAEPYETPIAELNRLPLEVKTMAEVDAERLGKLGIIRSRVASILALAREMTAGNLRLQPGRNVALEMQRLEALPGIGPWTSSYLAMRALRWPDAFPAADYGVLLALGLTSGKEAEKRSQAWRPWRAYAVQHLWRSLAGVPVVKKEKRKKKEKLNLLTD